MVFPAAVDDGGSLRECDVSHYVLQVVDVSEEIINNGAVFYSLQSKSVPPHHLRSHLNLEQEPIFSLQTYNFSKDIHLF